jgi:hypothetical protein
VATASPSRRNWRQTSNWTAMATGKMSSANSASGLATTSRACGSRWRARTRPVCTPDMVALAAMLATASATIPTHDTTQRSKSTGLRMRRSS